MPRAGSRLVPITLVLVFVVSAPRARAEWVDWIADAEVDLRYTDNLNNSAFNADEE